MTDSIPLDWMAGAQASANPIGRTKRLEERT
jgi:hypothetical protein